MSLETKRIRKRITSFIEVSKKAVDSAATDGRPYMPVVAVYRYNEVVPAAVLIVARVPESLDTIDVALGNLPITVLGFDADLVVLAADSYRVRVGTNPLTGQPWNPGEIGEYFSTFGNPDGLVQETLIVNACAPSLAMVSVELPYLRHDDATLTWLEPHELHDSHDGGLTEIAGKVADALRAAWSAGERLTAETPVERWVKDRLVTDSLERDGMASVASMTPEWLERMLRETS
jgi:hypothetical protein